MIRRLWAFLLMPTISLLLAGCYGIPCPIDPLDKEASYRWLINGRRYFDPLNTWVRNESLEKTLLKAYREGGLDALKSRYGLDCTSRVTSPPCGDCYTCQRTIAKRPADEEWRPATTSVACAPL